MARLEGASNHTLNYINNIYINFHEINPQNTRSYVPTPKNKDNKRFLYATVISVYYDQIDKKHPTRISKNLLKFWERLNIDNKEFPPKIKDIEQFEKDNPDIPITLFKYDHFIK